MSERDGGQWPELENLLKPKEPAPVPFVLRWWPIIIFLVACLAGLYSVQADVDRTQTQLAAIEATFNKHEERQQRERAELLSEIRDLRGDVKTLLSRPSVK